MNEGRDRMRAWAREFPDQLVAALDHAAESGWNVPPSVFLRLDPRFLLMGMGGSGSAARVAALLMDQIAIPETPAECVVAVSDPTLPRWVDPLSNVLIVSYSGRTWEALAAWRDARARGVLPFAIASGGPLAEQAVAAGARLFQVPAGYAPRAALGWMMVGSALFLARSQRVEAESQLRSAAVTLREEIDLWESGSCFPGRDPVLLGSNLGRRRSFFYAPSEATAVLAHRWRTQLAENAKVMAGASALPEAAHNEIEAWGNGVEAAPGAPPLCIVLDPGLTESEERKAARSASLDEIRRAGAEVQVVPGRGETVAARILSLLTLADFASLAAADVRGVDPFAVPALERVKAHPAGR